MPVIINQDDLVDIRDISVDNSLPQKERIIDFMRKIKNPYRYKCGIFTITAKHKENGPSLEDCLLSALNKS